MSSFGKCAGGGRRSAARESAPLTAIFTTRRRSGAAVAVDVSRTGIRLTGTSLPDVDEELLLAVEGLKAFGTVMWRMGEFCGVEFDVPLSADVLAELRGRVSEAAGLPPELKAALDDWVQGFAR